MSVTWSYFLPAPVPPAPPAAATRIMFRDAVKRIAPPWLQRKYGGGLLYALANELDELTDRTVAALGQRFPGIYSDDSLPNLGRDRRIRRGRVESTATYALRLRGWLDAHRLRGGPYGMLTQLFAFYAPSSFAMRIVYTSGRRYLMDAAGVITRDDIVWTPPGPALKWARWWLHMDWPDPVDTDGTWADPGTWNDGGVWDSNLTAVQVRDLRLIPREWNAAHAVGMIVLESPLETVQVSVEGQ